MFSEHDEDEPASVIVSTHTGGKYDINNITGKRKIQLITEGEIKEEAFDTPPNMPGKKLKEYRENLAKSRKANADAVEEDTPNDFNVGDLVKFDGHVSEVVKVHEKKGVLIHKREGGKMWVRHSKVEAVAEPKDE